MDQQMSVLFLILLVFKSFSQTTTTTTQHHSSNYDITETLRNAIHVILQNFKEIIRYDVKPQYNSTGTYNLKLENKTFSFNESDGRNYPCSTKNLYSNFIDNEIRITIGMSSRHGKGILTGVSDLNKTNKIEYLYTLLGNISIEMSESSKNNSNEKLLIRDSFQEYQGLIYIYHNGTMSIHEEEHLKQLLKPILLRHIYNELREYGKHIWKKLRHHTSTIFTSTHPNFFNDPQQYYYLVPDISYMCFNLRNITIRGLTNFESINKTHKYGYHVETTLHVLIKNISGEMILDYGSEIEKPMKLSFVANDVFIRANLNINCSNVEIQNYRVIKTGLNVSLTEQQSAIIIQCIESAIALSLMPSMKIHRTNDQLSKVYDMRCPLGKLMNEMMNEMTNKENWNAMKKVLNKWVPFDDDQVTTKNTVPNLITSSNKTDPYEYHTSFQNITIKLISARNSNPKDIQCEFPNNLKIIHQINAAPEQKFHWNSNKGDGVDLSFHANFTSISFSQINTNSSSSNTSCEFQLNSDENTKVELASDKNTIENEGSILKKKIDTTLVSVAKKPFISNFKQLVCLPFKICSKTVKMIDDFFLHFIDEVLNKCSLRRDKINDK